MRKLASIRRIDNIEPIPDADAIEVATIGGWKVVIQKDEYTVGDLAVYCEIDCWIPHTLAPFLSKGKEPREYNGVPGERLRTIRLRGQLSQGLILPLKHLTDYGADLVEGDDVSDVLGIQKWERPIPVQLRGQMKGSFPSHTPRSDQERCQNLVKEFQEWDSRDLSLNLDFEVTEKLDGSSMTVYSYGDEVGVCSRNIDLKQTDDNAFWNCAIKNQLTEKVRGKNISIQGEMIGEGIQGNPYKLKGVEFYCYDIWDIDKQQYFSPVERVKFCKEHAIKHVPIVTYENYYSFNMGIDTLLMSAEGYSKLNANVIREGLVFKLNSSTERISFKCISNTFLLKGND